ncbi:MAG: response regulator [Pseudomonadota bacterium]
MDEAGKKIRVLLVDDEADYLTVLFKRLTRRGFDISTAHNGAAGIQTLRRANFDVAVVDLKMDDMDGLEVLKVFKAMDPCLAVIILTGHGSEKAAREGVDQGAFDYLTKPCDLEDLINKIKAAHASGLADRAAGAC